MCGKWMGDGKRAAVLRYLGLNTSPVPVVVGGRSGLRYRTGQVLSIRDGIPVEDMCRRLAELELEECDREDCELVVVY